MADQSSDAAEYALLQVVPEGLQVPFGFWDGGVRERQWRETRQPPRVSLRSDGADRDV